LARPSQNGHVEGGVEHGGGVDGAFVPVVADGGLEVVGAAHGKVVAAVAGNEPGLGEAGIEIEFLAQFHQGRVVRLGGLDRLDGFLVGGVNQRRPEDEAGQQDASLHSYLPVKQKCRTPQ
jgi:hypothetical protein